MNKVELINYTGMDNPDPLWAARHLIYIKSTRLAQTPETRDKIAKMTVAEVLKQISYIANTIRSSWEFIDYTFQISEVTRSFTHQLVRTRTASFAQQSMRTVDMTGFKVKPMHNLSAEQATEAAELNVKTEGFYNLLIIEGIPAQDAREFLPHRVLTNIVAKVNLRTLADLVGKRLASGRAQSDYEEVVRGMVDCALKVHNWAHPFLFPEREQTPFLDKILRAMVGAGSIMDNPDVVNARKELEKLKAIWG